MDRSEYFREYYKRPEVRERQNRYMRELVKKRRLNPEIREKEYIKRRERNQKIKLQVISHYSQGKVECACCGDKHIEFLSIDHIGGGGNRHIKEIKKFGINFYRWLIENNFPEGYRVLCMNCNFALGHRGYCPHEKERKAVGV